MSRTREYASATDRKRAWRERMRDLARGADMFNAAVADAHEQGATDAAFPKRVLVGNAFIPTRGVMFGIPYVVVARADGSAEVRYTRRGGRSARVLARSRSDAYADGSGRCHDSEHVSTPVRVVTSLSATTLGVGSHHRIARDNGATGAYVPHTCPRTRTPRYPYMYRDTHVGSAVLPHVGTCDPRHASCADCCATCHDANRDARTR